jgi:TPP-dependent pyruvate/acetoin dehydrogenase alpha subunit
MYLIRKVEEKIIEIYHTDKIKSPVHLSIGQEAASVGVCSALDKSDIVFGTYRSHALYLAKGGNLKKMIAELFGKNDGMSSGKAGSMHLGDKTINMIHTSAIVSTSLPHAVGYSFNEKMKKTNNIVVSFFGDGATEEGVFYESINFASLMNLPVLFICENNLYAINTHYSKRTPMQNYVERARAFGIESTKVENNIENINIIANDLISKIRVDNKPRFLEIETYRYREHVGPNYDWDLGYRTEEEVKSMMHNDELERIGNIIAKNDKLEIENKVNDYIIEAFKYAELSENPYPSELMKDVFCEK